MAVPGFVLRKRVWIPVLLAAGGGGLFCAAHLYYTLDEEPPACGDLLLVRREVIPEANGYLLLQEIQFQLPEEEQIREIWGMAFTEDWDAEAAREVLAKNSWILKTLDGALRLSGFQFPDVASFQDIAWFDVCWYFAELLSLRIYARLVKGEEKEALDDALALVRLGHLLEEGQGSLNHYAQGQAIKVRGIEQFTKALSRSDPGVRLLGSYAEVFARYGADEEALADALRLDYRLHADGFGKIDPDVLDEMYRSSLDPGLTGILPRWLLFNPNQTRRLFAEAYRDLLRALREPGKDARSPLPGGWNPWLPSKNLLGKQIFDEVIRPLKTVLKRLHQEKLAVARVRVLVALRRFSLERGRLPDSLGELVPAYLPAVPLDPYDGAPLGYSREERTISSRDPAEDPFPIADRP